MEFGLRRHVTNLIGVSEKKKINKREKEKQSTFKDKTLLSKIEQENVSFVLGNQKTPLQDKEKKKRKTTNLYSGRSQKNYVASEKKGNLISKKEKVQLDKRKTV